MTFPIPFQLLKLSYLEGIGKPIENMDANQASYKADKEYEST